MYLISVTQSERGTKLQSAKNLARSAGYSDVIETCWNLANWSVDLVNLASLTVTSEDRHESDEVLGLMLGMTPQKPAQLSHGPWIQIRVDIRAGAIHVTRDPAGLMAAFFVKVSHGYLVSDSVPVLLACNGVSRVVNIQALNEYWFLDFCIPPKTIWRDIQAVPNGHSVELSFEPGRKSVYEQNWVPGLTATRAEPLSSDKAPAALRAVVLEDTQRAIDSSKGRFVNLLSGGVDSSVVLAACHVLGKKPQHAITFKGVGDSDESGLAAITARHLRVPLCIAEADASDLLADAHQVVDIWGQPYAHGSVHAMQILLRSVPEGSVVFTGDGGGEAFSGLPARLSSWRLIADPVYRLFNSLPLGLRRNLYRNFSASSFATRAFGYLVELKSACNEGELLLRSGPITQWEAEAAIRMEKLHHLSKSSIVDRLNTLASKSALSYESIFARSLVFWWSSEGVYAKTWRLLDAEGVVGLGPLTGPRFFETVKRIPLYERGRRKQALRDAFADVLPKEVLNAKKRGLRPLNRELIAQEADEGIAWIADGGSEAWDAIFDRETIKSFWRAHRDGKVFRSNLLYKAIIFRAWCDQWQPEIPQDHL